MASGSGTGGTDSECEGEEQEDPSSSSLVHDELEVTSTHDVLKQDSSENKSDKDELAAFRQQWQRELEPTPTRQRNPEPQQVVFDSVADEEKSKSSDDELSVFRQQWQRELESTPTPTRQKDPEPQKIADIPLSDEDKAKQLFLRGVELERSGKLYEAIQHYKRAIQIVPDVETRFYENEFRADSPEEESETEEVSPVDNANASDDEDAVEGEDLLARLQRILAKKGTLCEPTYSSKSAHISWLPYEVMLVILRWVVSSELDAASLERIAGVCRGFYVLAREPDLWRALCVKTWGIECGVPRARAGGPGGPGGPGPGSWRHMFVERPRVLLHGCYISKTTYLRHGENSFQDHSYRPWYLIDYYRYLRFFPEGLVLMWTTAEEPLACVGPLKHRHNKNTLGILPGHYRLIGNKVVIVIKKTTTEKKPAQSSNTRFRARRKEFELQEQSFHMELELHNVRSRRNFQLQWRRYSVCMRRDQWTHFELSPAKFPPFSFSRVRNYTAETHAPLLCTYAYT